LNRADDTSNDAAGYMYVNHEIGGVNPLRAESALPFISMEV